MTKKCICEICTCGRHRCPHRPNNVIMKGNQPCNITEYNNVYKAHPLQLRDSCKPPAEAPKGGHFESKTTQREDFIKHPMDKPYVRVPEQYKRPEGNIEDMTSYKKEYTEKYAAPAKAIRHEGQRQIGGKFQGEPTYNADYKKWDSYARVGPYTNQNTWCPPTQRFEGQSTMQQDFIRYNQGRRQMIKPSGGANLSNAPFDDRTGYRESYIKHPLEPKYVHPHEQYKASGIPFDDSTTFKRDYQGYPGEMRKSCRPDNQAFSSGQPLADVTTFRDDYRKWPAEKPYVHQVEGYKKPEGHMETQTTHKMTYTEMPIERTLAKRPGSANLAKQAPFDGNTSYANDYPKWSLDGRPKAMMRDEYHPNNAPFEGISTQKAHFIPHDPNPSHSFKPDNTAFKSDARFQDDTMYRTDYTKKQIGACPAISIDRENSTFQFLHIDGKGHKVYQPVYETISDLNRNMKSPNRMQMSVA